MPFQNERNKTEQFVGIAAIGNRHHDIARSNHAQIAMIGIQGVQIERRGTCRSQCGCNLTTDMARFTNTGYDYFARTIPDERYRLLELFSHAGNQIENRLCLNLQASDTGFKNLIHRSFFYIKVPDIKDPQTGPFQ